MVNDIFSFQQRNQTTEDRASSDFILSVWLHIATILDRIKVT